MLFRELMRLVEKENSIAVSLEVCNVDLLGVNRPTIRLFYGHDPDISVPWCGSERSHDRRRGILVETLRSSFRDWSISRKDFPLIIGNGFGTADPELGQNTAWQ